MADHDLIVLRRHSFCGSASPKVKIGEARPRRYSTAPFCHLPDRAVTIEPNLDNPPEPTASLITNYGRQSAVSTANPSYKLATLPAQLLREGAPGHRRHRSVVISGLPRTLNIRDILCRVRGGPLTNCSLSTGPGLSGQKAERYAILTFENPKDAANYAQFMQDPSAKAIWTFSSQEKEEDEVAQIHYHTDHGLHFKTDPDEIALAPWAHEAISGATRCLVVKACPMTMVERVFIDFRLLPHLLRISNFRSQMEDIWLDNFVDHVVVNDDSQSTTATFADLHIWFTNIDAAMATMFSVRLTDRFGLSTKLRCEPDPCAQDVSTLVDLSVEEEQLHQLEGSHRWHSHGNISLLTLFDHGTLDLVFQEWQKVAPVNNVASNMVNDAAAAILPGALVSVNSEAPPHLLVSSKDASLHTHLSAVAFHFDPYALSNLSQDASTASSTVSLEISSPVQQSLSSTQCLASTGPPFPQQGQKHDMRVPKALSESEDCHLVYEMKAEDVPGCRSEALAPLTDAQDDIQNIPSPTAYPTTS